MRRCSIINKYIYLSEKEVIKSSNLSILYEQFISIIYLFDLIASQFLISFSTTYCLIFSLAFTDENLTSYLYDFRKLIKIQVLVTSV